jgi:hypothetical protein
LDELSDEKFYDLQTQALWLEEREMNLMAAAIAKAFGAK